MDGFKGRSDNLEVESGAADDRSAHSRRIALVGDDERVQKVLSLVLRKAGHEVILGVQSQDEIAKALRDEDLRGRLDVILMDYPAPGTAALETLKAAARRRHHIRTLVTTPPERQHEVEKAGFDFLSKPYSISDVLDYLEPNKTKTSKPAEARTSRVSLQEIQDIAVGLPKLRDKTGKIYAPMFVAGGNELVVFEDGKEVLRYNTVDLDGRAASMSPVFDGRSLHSRMAALQTFVERMEGTPHLVGFFGDDTMEARFIELHYLALGLYAGQTCAYIYPPGPDYATTDQIRNQMSEHLRMQFGETDETAEMLMKRFHVFNVASVMRDPEGEIVAASRVIRGALERSGTPPYRLVVHVYDEIATKEEMTAHIALEKSVHEGFERWEGSFLCNHYSRLVSLEPRLFQMWLGEMMKTHDYAFYTMGDYSPH